MSHSRSVNSDAWEFLKRSCHGFPREFREGMEARAGMIGDVQSNHPTKWSPPEWDWPDTTKRTRGPVRLTTIAVVIKLRCSSPLDVTGAGRWSPSHSFIRLRNDDEVQRPKNNQHCQGDVHAARYCITLKIRKSSIISGFVDGISQPVVQAG